MGNMEISINSFTMLDAGYTMAKKTGRESEMEPTFPGDLSSKDRYLNLNRNLPSKCIYR